jgi:hypothetical protein
VQLSHAWSRATPIFDDEHLVSLAGLAPVMGLAERAGLSELIEQRVRFTATRVKSAGVNPAGKLTSIVAGMACGADSIEDLDVIRSGGMPRLFGGVYACATVGQLLREFSHGHALQLASVARAHLVNLVRETTLLPGIEDRVLVDIDSLLRPVYGHAKQGASFGHTKIAGKQVLRRGLSPLATTISTERGAPVVAGIRLRAGRAGSGKGAASMARRFRVRHQRRRARLHQGGRPVLRGAGQERRGEPGHRLHPGRRVDPGALPGRSHRPGHRGADQRRRGRRGRVHRVHLEEDV